MLNFPIVLASCHFCFAQNNATQYPKQTLKWRSYSTYLWNDSRVQTLTESTCTGKLVLGGQPRDSSDWSPCISLKISWENLIKDQRIFPFLIVSLILITFYRAPWIREGNLVSRVLSYPPIRRAGWREPWERGWREGLRAAVCLDMGSGRIHKRQTRQSHYKTYRNRKPTPQVGWSSQGQNCWYCSLIMTVGMRKILAMTRE